MNKSEPGAPSPKRRKNDFHISAIPNDRRIDGIEPPVYNRYSTWVLIDNRGPQEIYRILLADNEHVYLLKVGGMDGSKPLYFSPSKRASDRIRKARLECDKLYYLQRFRAVHDSFVPVQMEDGVCPLAHEEMFQSKIEIVSYALSEWGDLLIQSKHVYANAINSLVSQFGFSDVSIRRWIETNYFYREHHNAMLNRTWEQGGNNPSQNNKPERKPRKGNDKSTSRVGRPVSSIRIGMSEVHDKKILAPRIATLMRNYIRKEVWETIQPYRFIHRRMLDECLVSYNKGKNGEILKHKIDENKLPPPKQLMRIGRRFFNEALAYKAATTGKIRGPEFQKNGGSANDIVHDGLPIYDMDATIADNYLLYGDDIIEIDGCKKPTVIIAKDRVSKAIVGLYITFRPERAEGYLGCLISACMRKESELALWEASHLDGIVYGCPSGIFVDRGAGSSYMVTDTAVKQMHTSVIFAKPGTPQAKGGVENVMGRFQAVLSEVITGSYFPSGDIDYDKVLKRHAEDGAIPIKVFMRALWEMASQHNLKANTESVLTPGMMRNSKFSSNPRGVFNYYKERRRGDISWDWTLETMIRKFGNSDGKSLLAPDGIVTKAKKKFSSFALVRIARAHKQQYGETYQGIFYSVPNAPSVMYWESPEGRLVELEAKNETLATYTPGHEWLHEYENMRRNHSTANALKEYAASEKKNWNARKNDVSKDTQKRMVSIDKRSTKKNKHMTPQERETAKLEGIEHLERKHYEAVYGVLRPKVEDELTEISAINSPMLALGFNNNQVLRIDE